ncbi:hypothetical protein B0H19DRAFT_1064166 [Mycena capillaripes]|nr:hypothetical protein B0H19DRAFT_1064166 [Mycena capillaripes]
MLAYILTNGIEPFLQRLCRSFGISLFESKSRMVHNYRSFGTEISRESVLRMGKRIGQGEEITDVNHRTLGNPGSKGGKAARSNRGDNDNNTASEAVAGAEEDTKPSGAHYAYHTSVGDITTGNPNISRCVQKARESPNWPEWENAINTQLDILRRMGTWQLEDCPKDRKPVGCKWLFDLKTYQ